MRLNRAALVSMVTAFALFPCQGVAQPYPNRPVRVIVGNQVGSGMDVTARILSQKLSEKLGVQFVVDNRPGAAGIIGADLLAKASADGYTLLIVNTAHAIRPFFQTKLPFDTLKDFAPVALVATSANILTANPAASISSLSQLIAAAKSKPQQITVGVLAPGGFQHVTAVLFESMARVQFLHVQYKGTPAVVTDLVAGRISLTFSGIPAVLSFIRSAKLKALGVTTLKRSSIVPDIPTFHEAGLPGYDATLWFAMLAPAQTPSKVISKLNAEIAEALKDAEVRKQLLSQGLEPSASTPAELGTRIESEISKWRKILRAGS